MNPPLQGQRLGWEILDCPVCGGQSFTPLFEKEGEPFVACDRCGLMLINPRPAFEQAIKTYDAAYSDLYIKKPDKKLKRCRRWARRMRRLVPQGRWLDIGCSAGFLVKAAEEQGYEVYGIDVEPAGIRYAREVLGLARVRQGTLQEQCFDDGFFDVISLYDVIEHVPDLNGVVAEIKRLLSPGGVIEIRTPDRGHWRVPRDLSTWKEVKPSEHLYYFSAQTLGLLLARHGLGICKRRFNLKPGLKVYARHRAAQVE